MVSPPLIPGHNRHGHLGTSANCSGVAKQRTHCRRYLSALTDDASYHRSDLIDNRTEPWGIQVSAVEIKDVLIPQSLENAMSMQAQAERERQARVILGDSERQIAEKFAAMKQGAIKAYQKPVVIF